MTSVTALRLLPGDRVAVAPVANANWDTVQLRIGHIKKVMSNGAFVSFDDPKTREEEKGLPVASSRIRFALFDEASNRWTGVKRRPITAGKGEEMPEKAGRNTKQAAPDTTSDEARELYERLKSGGHGRIDEFIRLMEDVKLIREREDAEEKLATAENNVEIARADLSRADEEVVNAKSMVDEAETRRAAAFEALKLAERDLARLSKAAPK